MEDLFVYLNLFFKKVVHKVLLCLERMCHTVPLLTPR
jgi:hypothetical protein